MDDECGRCVRECESKDNEIELLRRRVCELETPGCRADGGVVNTTHRLVHQVAHAQSMSQE